MSPRGDSWELVNVSITNAGIVKVSIKKVDMNDSC